MTNRKGEESMKLSRIMGATLVAFTTFAGSVASAATIDLGFALDESGSVGSTNFGLSRTGLANALAKIPTSGTNQYRISVITFDSGTNTIIPPTVVTAGNLANLQAQVNAISYNGGGTDIAEAVDTLTANFVNAGLSAATYLNVATDGGSSASALATAAANAQAAGIDGLSFEAIGSGASINTLLRSCFGNSTYTDPGGGNTAAGCSLVNDENNLPDATKEGFVLAIDNFLDFENAIAAKVQAIVDDTGGGGNPNVVPLPAAGWLLIAGLGLLGATARRKKA